MRKLDKSDIAIISFLISGVIICAIIFFTSCQPKDPLKGLNCPCKVISAELTYNGHKVKYIDKNGELRRPVISKALYDQYHKRLNK